ncbi:hypothetical protein [Embleya sp. NPDC001921]
MSDSSRASKEQTKEAGAFSGVRRKGPAKRTERQAEEREARQEAARQRAAQLMAQGEEVADAGFLGDGYAPPPAAPVTPVVPVPTLSAVPAAPAVPPVPTVAIPAPGGSGETESKAAPIEVVAAPPVSVSVPAPVAVEPPAVVAESAGDPPASDTPASDTSASNTGDVSAKAPRVRQVAHKALHKSFADSRTNSRTWETHGANLLPDVWDALRARIAKDRRSAGNPDLAAGHYMDVVFRRAPVDVGELIRLYQKFSEQRMGYLGKGRKSTFRLSPAGLASAAEIKGLLDEADYARKGLYVVSALVVQLLRDLEAEGPLSRPQIPPMV